MAEIQIIASNVEGGKGLDQRWAGGCGKMDIDRETYFPLS